MDTGSVKIMLGSTLMKKMYMGTTRVKYGPSSQGGGGEGVAIKTIALRAKIGGNTGYDIYFKSMNFKKSDGTIIKASDLNGTYKSILTKGSWKGEAEPALSYCVGTTEISNPYNYDDGTMAPVEVVFIWDLKAETDITEVSFSAWCDGMAIRDIDFSLYKINGFSSGSLNINPDSHTLIYSNSNWYIDSINEKALSATL